VDAVAQWNPKCQGRVKISLSGSDQKRSATAWTRRRHGFPISRLLFRSFGVGLAGRLCRFPMGLPGSLRRLLTRAFDSFLCLSSYGLSGLLGFLAHGLGSLFGFLPDRFSGFLGLLPYRFYSLFNCFTCFFRPLLYLLHHALLAERVHHCGREENSNQSRDFHMILLLLIHTPHMGSDHAV